MDTSTDKRKLLIKLVPIVVAAGLLLILIAMSQIPPSGQWVKDSVAPVLPTLKYSHINESWGKSYKREDEQPIPVAPIEAASPQPLPGLPRDNNKGENHSYFSSPRLLSARNAYYAPGSSQYTYQSSAPANIAPENTAPAEDLLSTGYLTNNETVYDPAFGAARDTVKVQ